MRRSTNSLLEHARNDPESTRDQNGAGGVTSGGSKLNKPMRRGSTSSLMEYAGSDPESTRDQKGTSDVTSGGSKPKILDRRSLTKVCRSGSTSLLSPKGSLRKSFTKLLGASKEDLRTEREFDDNLHPTRSKNSEFSLSASQKNSSGESKLQILDRRSLLSNSKGSKSVSTSLLSPKGSFRRTSSGSTLGMAGGFRRSANSLTKLIGASKEDLRTELEFDDILNPTQSKNAEFSMSASQKVSSLSSRGLMGSFSGSSRFQTKTDDVVYADDDEEFQYWDEDGEEFTIPLNSALARDRIIALACRELELAYD